MKTIARILMLVVILIATSFIVETVTTHAIAQDQRIAYQVCPPNCDIPVVEWQAEPVTNIFDGPTSTIHWTARTDAQYVLTPYGQLYAITRVVRPRYTPDATR